MNRRFLTPRIPLGFTAEMAILQPTRIILKPNAAHNPDIHAQLTSYFKTTGTGISLSFDKSMVGQQAGEHIYEVFDVYWMSLTAAVVVWNRIDTE